jgi:PAS domain S-box-containing protein
MIEPAVPSNETMRIAALYSLNILDTPAEERFDRITRLAQKMFDVPIAVVSLVDTNRQWFKSCQGLDASETPRSVSFCGHAILENKALIISNALDDIRFADNPLVTGPPNIRFYAGQPLKGVDGSRLGTLCIIDSKPHQLSQSDLLSLRDLAIMVENELNVADFNKAAQLIRNNEVRLHTLLNTLTDAIITLDTNDQIETINQAGLKMFGYAESELQGKNIRHLISASEEPIQSENSHSFTGESIGIKKDNRQFPIELALSQMQIDAKILYTCIIRDITERKHIERLKSEFISMVSHELRTPLTSIRGSLGLIAGGATGTISEQSKNMVDIAYRNSERLLNLINDILDIDKLESGKMRFDTRTFEVMPLVEQAIESNSGYADKYMVHYSITHYLPKAKINVDADRFMQVMSNLLSNAAKFSPAAGTIEISVKQHEKLIRISVVDYGSGVPDAFRDKLFKKFSQADSSDTRQKGGTGLGLSITKTIVEKMGGEIGFELRNQLGTCFYFDLPEIE